MQAERDAELTLRLVNLIDVLAEETGVAEPHEDAARTWTEAAVREWFRSRGAVSPRCAAALPDLFFSLASTCVAPVVRGPNSLPCKH